MKTTADLLRGGGTGMGHNASATQARGSAIIASTFKASIDPPSQAKTKAGKQRAAAREFHRFGQGKMHSSSANGPVVTNPRQAVAIALSVAGLSKKKRK